MPYTCAKFKTKNPREPLVPHEVPQRPWAKLGTDIFEFAGKPYLVVVDYFSKYPEVCRLENITASCVISHLKSMFARHGIPDELIADKMPLEVLRCDNLHHSGTLRSQLLVQNTQPQMDRVNGWLA